MGEMVKKIGPDTNKRVMMALDRSPKSISAQNEFDLIFRSIEQKLRGQIY